MNKRWVLLISVLLIGLPSLSWANQALLPALSISGAGGKETYSLSLQVLIAMTLMSFIPALLLTMTAFTRIVIVLVILRQAIGMPQTPTNQIVIGLSLFLTLFVMAPTFNKINDQAVQPYLHDQVTAEQAITRAEVPFRGFMLSQTRVSDIEFFAELARVKGKVDGKTVSLLVLMPAFLTSELKTAFQIGFLLFLPFLVIDLVVASVLMAMGMMMLSPLIISLPFKIMLFVLVDGWSLVLGSLASSFVT